MCWGVCCVARIVHDDCRVDIAHAGMHVLLTHVFLLVQKDLDGSHVRQEVGSFLHACQAHVYVLLYVVMCM